MQDSSYNRNVTISKKGIVLSNILKYTLNISLAILILAITSGCFRGTTSEDPPIHLNPNMDIQPKYTTQSESRFFKNGAAMRMPVEGTVARGELFEDHALYFGKSKDGSFVNYSPIPVTEQLVIRGKERYNIYCSPCHNTNGDGKGIIISKGFIPPPSFYDEKVKNYPDGHLFNAITNGFRNMASYKHQVPVDDRWAIVSYIRSLQRTQK